MRIVLVFLLIALSTSLSAEVDDRIDEKRELAQDLARCVAVMVAWQNQSSDFDVEVQELTDLAVEAFIEASILIYQSIGLTQEHSKDKSNLDATRFNSKISNFNTSTWTRSVWNCGAMFSFAANLSEISKVKEPNDSD